MKKNVFFLCLVLALGSNGTASEDGCGDGQMSAHRQASLRADGVTRIHVRAGAGSLRIEGGRSQDVQAWGKACADDPKTLEQIAINIERRGNELFVVTRFPEQGWFDCGRKRLDLELEVPRHIPLVVRDGSGSVEIEGVAALELRDGSGALSIRDVEGDLDLRDGSGSATIERVGGDLRVRDGSGPLSVAGVTGTASVRDGSGDMTLSDIGRDLTISRDGSGSIEVKDVGGNVHVVRDGSGGISASRVRGDFRVDRDGSGHIRHDNVGGSVHLPRK